MVELININSNYPAHNGVIMLCLLGMDEYRSELRTEIWLFFSKSLQVVEIVNYVVWD